jgi:hypothetical protein
MPAACCSKYVWHLDCFEFRDLAHVIEFADIFSSLSQDIRLIWTNKLSDKRDVSSLETLPIHVFYVSVTNCELLQESVVDVS